MQKTRFWPVRVCLWHQDIINASSSRFIQERAIVSPKHKERGTLTIPVEMRSSPFRWQKTLFVTFVDDFGDLFSRNYKEQLSFFRFVHLKRQMQFCFTSIFAKKNKTKMLIEWILWRLLWHSKMCNNIQFGKFRINHSSQRPSKAQIKVLYFWFVFQTFK